MSQESDGPKTFVQKLLDLVERAGNKVPHPAVIFLVLIALVIVLSHVLYVMGASVTTEVITPESMAPAWKSPDSYPYAEELSAPHTPLNVSISRLAARIDCSATSGVPLMSMPRTSSRLPSG